MWRDWNCHTPLVGLQNGAAVMQNSLEVSQKIKIELPYDPEILLLCNYSKDCHQDLKSC